MHLPKEIIAIESDEDEEDKGGENDSDHEELHGVVEKTSKEEQELWKLSGQELLRHFFTNPDHPAKEQMVDLREVDRKNYGRNNSLYLAVELGRNIVLKSKSQMDPKKRFTIDDVFWQELAPLLDNEAKDDPSHRILICPSANPEFKYSMVEGCHRGILADYWWVLFF